VAKNKRFCPIDRRLFQSLLKFFERPRNRTERFAAESRRNSERCENDAGKFFSQVSVASFCRQGPML